MAGSMALFPLRMSRLKQLQFIDRDLLGTPRKRVRSFLPLSRFCVMVALRVGGVACGRSFL
jgi:hypothetical protein